MEQNNQNLGSAFQQLFGAKLSGTGEEELLRVASTFAVQLTSKQVKILLYLHSVAQVYRNEKRPEVAQIFDTFIQKYVEYKQYNNSDVFIMTALQNISLRKFMNENSMKINVQK